MSYQTVSTVRTVCGGTLHKLKHHSEATTTDMAVSVYLPPQSATKPVPILIYLAGLTCSPDNGSDKSFLNQWAGERGLAVVYPDTSPRGLKLPGENDSWDFGEAASFYIDATRPPWHGRYAMETYVVRDLLGLLRASDFLGGHRVDGARVSICGHSMGGHGAMTLFLKHPAEFRSCSAWAPIANPSQCPWGKKAFSGYFGEEKEARELWRRNDATELVKQWREFGGNLRMRIDVGTGDNFYKDGQLLVENFETAAKEAGLKDLEVNYHEDYDHSYHFVSAFSKNHVEHAARFLLE